MLTAVTTHRGNSRIIMLASRLAPLQSSAAVTHHPGNLLFTLSTSTSSSSSVTLPTRRWKTTIDSSRPASLVYEGPFASLSLKLKRVSIASAFVGVVGIPILIYMHTGDVPAIGQAAVGGTAMLGATGSTMAMSFCFSPYIHKLEKVPIRECHRDGSEGAVDVEAEEDLEGKRFLIRATTRNLLAMKVETVFDPETDVELYKGIRPFCNFLAKGRPMYLHAEILEDDELRMQLVGNVDLNPKKGIDDEDEVL